MDVDVKMESVDRAVGVACNRAGGYGDYFETADLVEELEARGWVFVGPQANQDKG